jgi:hypothetical protein
LTSNFTAAKSLEMSKVAETYGIQVRHNKALCPFHDDKTPSLGFKSNIWKCFVCDIGGDSVDFVSKMFNLPPLGALQKLNKDFNLCLDFDKTEPEDFRKIYQNQQERDFKRKLSEWADWAVLTIITSFRECREIIKREAPPDSCTEPAQKWLKALKYFTILEYLTNYILVENWDALELFKDWGEFLHQISRNFSRN